MSIHLRIFLVVFSILLTIIIFKLISKNKLSIKYSLFWLFSAMVIILVGLFPNFINIFTKLIGFETTSNFVTGVILGLLLIITLLLTIIIADQKRRLKLLVQELSIVKSQIGKIDQKK